jgi:hypothetical protein
MMITYYWWDSLKISKGTEKYNVNKKKEKKTNNELQNTTQKLKIEKHKTHKPRF